MKHRNADGALVIRLERGELVVETLNSFFRESNPSGWLNGLGAFQWAELGFYDIQEKTYQFERHEKVELANLTGNVAVGEDGRPVLHIHCTVSDAHGRAFGGHLKEAMVNGTCEILVTPIAAELRRVKDGATGLNLLDL